jgi:hypothetical protein
MCVPVAWGSTTLSGFLIGTPIFQNASVLVVLLNDHPQIGKESGKDAHLYYEASTRLLQICQ